MRKTKQCPKCDSKKLLSIDVVADATSGGSASQGYLAVRFEGHSMMGNEKLKPVGKLEAVTCSECGYTEYYCADAKSLEPDGRGICWLT